MPKCFPSTRSQGEKKCVRHLGNSRKNGRNFSRIYVVLSSLPSNPALNASHKPHKERSLQKKSNALGGRKMSCLHEGGPPNGGPILCRKKVHDGSEVTKEIVARHKRQSHKDLLPKSFQIGGRTHEPI